MKISVFFVTGRPERTRASAEADLRSAGYENWAGLIMKPDDYDGTNVAFKSGARKKLTRMGYMIILNLGDQLSDLEGGFAERKFLLPNPFYTVP